MTSLSSNIVANLIGRAWPSLLGILFVPFYLRFMGIEAYGLVGFYATLQGVLGLLDLGIGSTMTRELARLSVVEDSNQKQRDLVRTLEILYWLIALAAGITIVFLAPLLARHWINAQQLSPEQLTTAIQLMGVAVALQFPFALYQGGLMGLQHQVLVNGVLAVVGTLRAGGAVLILWLVSSSITAFMGWQVIAGLVGSLIFMGLLWRKLPKHEKRPRFELNILEGLWRYAITLAGNSFIGVFLTQTDKIALSTILPLEQFAYYTLASTIASAIWMVISPINTAAFPRFAKLDVTNNYNSVATLFHSVSRYLCVLLFPIAGILTTFAHQIIQTWTNSRSIAEHTAPLAIVLIIATTINGICSIPANAAAAFGWPQLIAKVNSIQALVILPLIYILTSNFGAMGGALTWFLINATYIIFLLPMFFLKYLTQEWRSWAKNTVLLPGLISILIPVGFFYLIKLKEGWMNLLLALGPIWMILTVLLWLIVRPNSAVSE